MKINKMFKPDTPQEWSTIGASINRLGLAMTGMGAFEKNFTWVLVAAGLTWFGHEISEYFKQYFALPKSADEPETPKEP